MSIESFGEEDTGTEVFSGAEDMVFLGLFQSTESEEGAGGPHGQSKVWFYTMWC